MRSGPGRNGTSAGAVLFSGDRRSDHAASHPTGRSGASSTSSQGRLSTRRSASLNEQVVRTRPISIRNHGGPGRLEPGREQAATDCSQGLRLDQRTTPLFKEFEESAAQVGHRPGLLVLDRDRLADRPIIPVPSGLPTRGRLGGVDLEHELVRHRNPFLQLTPDPPEDRRRSVQASGPL